MRMLGVHGSQCSITRIPNSSYSVAYHNEINKILLRCWRFRTKKTTNTNASSQEFRIQTVKCRGFIPHCRSHNTEQRALKQQICSHFNNHKKLQPVFPAAVLSRLVPSSSKNKSAILVASLSPLRSAPCTVAG